MPHVVATRRYASLGETIRRARLEAGLTQAELAGTEVAVRTISRIERGHVAPSRHVLAYIAHRVGRPLGDFLGGSAPVREVDVASLVLLARARRLGGDLPGALRAARDADRLAAALDGLPVRARAALERAVCELAHGGSQDAERRLQDALVRARRAGLREDVSWAEYEVAAYEAERGECDRARAELERLIAQAESPELRATCAAFLIRLASPRTAISPDLLAGLDGAGGIRDLAGVARALESEAAAAYETGRTYEAVWAARHAVAIRTVLRARAEEAGARYEVGAAFLAEGARDQAETELLRARALAHDAGEPLVEARSLVALADLYAGCGRLAEAEVALERAQTLCAHWYPETSTG